MAHHRAMIEIIELNTSISFSGQQQVNSENLVEIWITFNLIFSFKAMTL